jgi:glycosyltransferase involved in cell wall biosynthesis
VLISNNKTCFGIINKIWREYSINNILKNTIKSSKTDDVLYMRIPYPSPFISKTLKSPRLCKIIIEYQTIELLEYQLKGKYWYILIDFLFGDAIRRYSDAIVGVTDEITKYQLARSGNPMKPHITIGNGIDVTSMKIRRCPSYPGNELHLICSANVNKWDGLDRLFRGLAEYNGPVSVTLHIAGEGSELVHLKRLARDMDIESQVVFHGYLTGKPLDDLFDKCHIAMGCLAIHRKGLMQTSELKAREYCARGIPFILSGVDHDFFHDDFPYLHKISADESPIDIEKIRKFAVEMFADFEHPPKMRQYAVQNLDWSVKMKRLKEFLTPLING